MNTFHTKTSPSNPVDTICFESGENLMQAIGFECPFYSLTHLPVEYSHNLTIPKEPPVAKNLPSFEIEMQ